MCAGPEVDLWEYETIGKHWRLLDAAAGVVGQPQGRNWFAMAAVGSRLLVHGGNVAGQGLTEVVADFWEYNTDDMLWRRLDATAGVQGVSPPALYRHDMVAINTSVYLYGGQTGQDKRTNALWCVLVAHAT